MGSKADLKRAKILNGSSNIDDYTIRYSSSMFFLNIPLSRGFTPLL